MIELMPIAINMTAAINIITPVVRPLVSMGYPLLPPDYILGLFRKNRNCTEV
jgi:hypothetical protein